jgi:hypothetical protein
MYLEIFTWWVLFYELSPFSKIPDLHNAANLGRHFLLLPQVLQFYSTDCRVSADVF